MSIPAYLISRLASLWKSWGLPVGSLGPIGILFLADLDLLAKRTVLEGNASWTDTLILCPSMHRQRDAPLLSKGEYPITANMTSGYVFRVENEATVHFLQQVGVTGHLTTLHVSERQPFSGNMLRMVGPGSAALEWTKQFATIVVLLYFLVDLQDIWGCGLLLALVFARLLTVVSIRLRCSTNWHGAKEPGQHGDLLVLLSQDRWVRLKGLTDDLKAVTSGQWLREENNIEAFLSGTSGLIVYLCAALSVNVSESGRIVFVFAIFWSSLCLSLSNATTLSFKMKGRIIETTSPPKSYGRRLDLASDLINETGRKDWALKLGMINRADSDFDEARGVLEL